MTLRLVASGDGDALALRNHLVQRIRTLGYIEVQQDAVRVVAWQPDAWSLEHWTPFSGPQPDEAASPGYRRALKRRHTQRDLPYGLDVWHAGVQVLCVMWAENGCFEVATFRRGEWEAAALAL